MSAWRVSDKHIDALVYWLLKAGLITDDEKNAVGADLWEENYASVNARYSEREEIDPYEYTIPEVIAGTDGSDTYDPENINHALKLVACYEYQSEEHSGWVSSKSFHRCDDLTKYLIGLGADREINDGPWGI
jgi:hypothetical protein